MLLVIIELNFSEFCVYNLQISPNKGVHLHFEPSPRCCRRSEISTVQLLRLSENFADQFPTKFGVCNTNITHVQSLHTSKISYLLLCEIQATELVKNLLEQSFPLKYLNHFSLSLVVMADVPLRQLNFKTQERIRQCGRCLLPRIRLLWHSSFFISASLLFPCVFHGAFIMSLMSGKHLSVFHSAVLRISVFIS